MNLIETLISEVGKRPLLWNRYDNEYSNRAARDCEWEKIAKLLKRDKDFVQQKWRNLRDQFQRESKKVKVPYDNPTKPYIQYYRGKWIYFQQMLFLKDVTSKISSGCYSSPEVIEIREEDIKEEVIEFGDYIFADHCNNDSDNYETEQTTDSLNDLDVQGVPGPKIEMIEEQDLENERLEEVRRKRKASETDEPAVSVKCERLETSATRNTEVECEIDDDLHFVKSLVPFLRKLNPIRKLLVRNEIQNLLIRESLCDKCRLGTNSCHNS